MRTYMFERGGARVRWLGAVHLELAGRGVLIGAPRGAVTALGASVDALEAVVLPSGHMRLLDGLVPLLAARTVSHPLEVISLVGEPRAMALVDAFGRGWSGRVQPRVDVVMPGQSLDVAGVEIDTRAARAGEPLGDAVERVTACGVRVRAAGLELVVVPSCAPSRGWRTFVGRADVAVVEVGVKPWPSGARPWRHDAAGAIAAARDASQLWLVGDDGRPLDTAEA
jgi:hypothetical protein